MAENLGDLFVRERHSNKPLNPKKIMVKKTKTNEAHVHRRMYLFNCS